MIKRQMGGKLRAMAKAFPLVLVTGPRQSGKTTLARSVFPNHRYVSLEDPDTREFATDDPRGFLRQYPDRVILDEVQRAPELFSYLQTEVDRTGRPGRYVLTGSHHFLLMEKISQTLAGRIRILHLLPFSLDEISRTAKLSLEHVLFQGLYPPIYDRRIQPRDWYPGYIQTYIERDVRLVKNVGDLDSFHKFLRLCAGRTGQLLNLSSLASDCGITHNTAKAWISILAAGFIVYLLPPYHRNFNKRLVKSPKLYFYDTGLACSLLGIEKASQISTHPLRGNIFETFILSEIVKHRYNRGLEPGIFFWRDKTGNEIDCVFEKGSSLIPVEIKSSQTFTSELAGNLAYWNRLAGRPSGPSFLIYAGEENQNRKPTSVVSWKAVGQFCDSREK